VIFPFQGILGWSTSTRVQDIEGLPVQMDLYLNPRQYTLCLSMESSNFGCDSYNYGDTSPYTDSSALSACDSVGAPIISCSLIAALALACLSIYNALYDGPYSTNQNALKLFGSSILAVGVWCPTLAVPLFWRSCHNEVQNIFFELDGTEVKLSSGFILFVFSLVLSSISFVFMTVVQIYRIKLQ